jgi:hypothetical protein
MRLLVIATLAVVTCLAEDKPKDKVPVTTITKHATVSKEASWHYKYIVEQYKPLKEKLDALVAESNALAAAQCEESKIKQDECHLNWDTGEITEVKVEKEKK